MNGPTRITRRLETFELVVERDFGAPPARLWRCWTTPDIAQWWGPHGWTTVVHEMDVRPGGAWRYSLAPEAGEEDPVHCSAVYREVEEPDVLSFDDGLADDAGGIVPGSALPVTVTILPTAQGSRLTITTRFADAAHLATAEPSGMRSGLTEAFDRLATHLSTAR